ILGDFQRGYNNPSVANDNASLSYATGQALGSPFSPTGDTASLALGALGMAKPVSKMITKIPKRYSAGAINDVATAIKNGSYQLKAGRLKQIYDAEKLI